MSLTSISQTLKLKILGIMLEIIASFKITLFVQLHRRVSILLTRDKHLHFTKRGRFEPLKLI